MAAGCRLLLLLAVAWAAHRCDAFLSSPGAPCIRGVSRLSRGVGGPLRERRAQRAAQRRPTAWQAALDEIEGVALTHHFVSVSDKISLHVVEAGRSDAPTVCLLHGFPDFWLSWRRQLPRLVQAGYRVICPDMRGYAASSKPAGIENYSEVAITGDVDALRKHFCGADGAFELLVGHDWGAAAAWGTMSWYPTLAKKLAILNVPHPKRFAAGLSTPQQLLKSWYVFAFQPPAIAEAGFAALNGELVRRVFTVDPDTPLEAWELDRYVEAASSGGMTGAINWYRAAGAGLWPANMPSVPAPLLEVIQAVQGVQGKLPAPPQGRLRSDVIECPVMILWGKRDPYLGQELARPPPGAVPDLRLHFLDATHWVHWDQHEAVTDYLLAFLQDAAAPNPLD